MGSGSTRTLRRATLEQHSSVLVPTRTSTLRPASTGISLLEISASQNCTTDNTASTVMAGNRVYMERPGDDEWCIRTVINTDTHLTPSKRGAPQKKRRTNTIYNSSRSNDMGSSGAQQPVGTTDTAIVAAQEKTTVESPVKAASSISLNPGLLMSPTTDVTHMFQSLSTLTRSRAVRRIYQSQYQAITMLPTQLPHHSMRAASNDINTANRYPAPTTITTTTTGAALTSASTISTSNTTSISGSSPQHTNSNRPQSITLVAAGTRIHSRQQPATGVEYHAAGSPFLTGTPPTTTTTTISGATPTRFQTPIEDNECVFLSPLTYIGNSSAAATGERAATTPTLTSRTGLSRRSDFASPSRVLPHLQAQPISLVPLNPAHYFDIYDEDPDAALAVNAHMDDDPCSEPLVLSESDAKENPNMATLPLTHIHRYTSVRKVLAEIDVDQLPEYKTLAGKTIQVEETSCPSPLVLNTTTTAESYKKQKVSQSRHMYSNSTAASASELPGTANPRCFLVPDFIATGRNRNNLVHPTSTSTSHSNHVLDHKPPASARQPSMTASKIGSVAGNVEGSREWLGEGSSPSSSFHPRLPKRGRNAAEIKLCLSNPVRKLTPSKPPPPLVDSLMCSTQPQRINTSSADICYTRQSVLQEPLQGERMTGILAQPKSPAGALMTVTKSLCASNHSHAVACMTLLNIPSPCHVLVDSTACTSVYGDHTPASLHASSIKERLRPRPTRPPMVFGTADCTVRSEARTHHKSHSVTPHTPHVHEYSAQRQACASHS
ncbi:hypothetical protein BASA61_002115 [Batrachochytrium salamandrivorans]|nr:hypothetical protein BASA61_002115 [Batrachochytrium salamandrivorans]